MSKLGSLVVMLAFVGCGRVGFQPAAADAEPDAPTLDGGPDTADAEPDTDAGDGGGFVAWTIGAPRQLTTADEDSDEIDLVFEAGRWMGAWHDSRDGNEEIYFAFLTADASFAAAPTRVSTSAGVSMDASLATSGSTIGVAYYDGTSGNNEIMFALLSMDATVLDTIALTSDPGNSTDPDLIWSGTEYIVYSREERGTEMHIYEARVDEAGVVTMPSRRVTSMMAESARQPTAVSLRSGVGLLWHDFRIDSELFYLRLDAAGASLTPETQVTFSEVPSRFPDMIDGQDGLLTIAFEDDRSGSREIWLMWLDPDGTEALAPVQVSNTADVSGNPAVAFDGTGYAVVWQQGATRDTGSIQFAYVSGGEVLQSAEIVEAADAKLPTIAWDGERFIAAWDATPVGGDIYASVISR